MKILSSPKHPESAAIKYANDLLANVQLDNGWKLPKEQECYHQSVKFIVRSCHAKLRWMRFVENEKRLRRVEGAIYIGIPLQIRMVEATDVDGIEDDIITLKLYDYINFEPVYK